MYQTKGPRPAEKRIRRAAAACYRCHARKVRCDASILGYPCTNCVLDGRTDCTLRPNATTRFKNLKQGQRRNTVQGLVKPNEEEHTTLNSGGEPCETTPQSAMLPRASGFPELLESPRQIETIYDSSGQHFIDLNALSLLPMSDVHILVTGGCLDMPPKSAMDVFLMKYFLLVHPTPTTHRESPSLYFKPCFFRAAQYVPYSIMLPRDLKLTMDMMLQFVPVEVIQQCGFKDACEARRTFYHRAKMLYDTNFESDPLVRAQGALLLTFHTTAEDPQATMTWNMCAIHNATATGLGLHPSLQDPNRCAKKRLWWSIFVRDRFLWLGRHRRPQFTSANFSLNIDYLQEEEMTNEIIMSPFYEPNVKRLLLKVFQAQCRLAVILTDVITISFSASDGDAPRLSLQELDIYLTRIKQLRAELARWEETVYAPLHHTGIAEPETVGIIINLTALHYQTARMVLGNYETLLVESHLDMIQDRSASILLPVAKELKDAVFQITQKLGYFSSRNLTEHIPLSVLAYCGTPMVLAAIDVKLSMSYSDMIDRKRTLDKCSEVIDQSRRVYDVTELFSQGTNQILHLAYAITKNLLLESNVPETGASLIEDSKCLEVNELEVKGRDKLLSPAFKRLRIRGWAEAFLKYPRAYLLISTCIDSSLATGRLPRNELLPPIIRDTTYVILGLPKLPWTIGLATGATSVPTEESVQKDQRRLRGRQESVSLNDTWYLSLLQNVDADPSLFDACALDGGSRNGNVETTIKYLTDDNHATGSPLGCSVYNRKYLSRSSHGEKHKLRAYCIERKEWGERITQSCLTRYIVYLVSQETIVSGGAPETHQLDQSSATSIITRANDSLDSLVDCARSNETMEPFNNIQACRFLSMRYDGSETSIMIPWDDPESDAKEAFVKAHHQQFGFIPVDRVVYVDTIRVRAIGCSVFHESSSSPQVKYPLNSKSATTTATPSSRVSTCFSSVGWVDTPVYHLNALSEGIQIQGPAMVINKTQTIVMSPDSKATIAQDSTSPENIDPVQLSIFRHRFMGVAEQMGRVLQNVSTSANIKERLDFTCAIFTPEGDLVANAPHVPAMIGSMAFAVRSQIAEWQGRLQDGNVLLSNTPAYGGVHLPDLTVITPVFDSAGKDIVFWAASRGHHADVGGILPGSMPPMSKLLSEEGAIFNSHLLSQHVSPAVAGPDVSKTMVTDLKAQVAANHCGARLMRRLIEEYSFPVVQVYMGAIQDSAELAVRNLLKRLAHERSGEDISAVDYMDDGTPIQLKVTIDPTDGSAIFDFTGTGPEVYGNWNAPIAICNSAVIFALRCMVNSDIPLNHGCIKPVQIIIPDGSLLRPSAEAAVCAGNVLTSQRIVDVIFKSFKVCAASQGCMNNLTFGNGGENGFGYYETIAGGSGAGPSWAGTGGVHTNMTNTRITDPESLERRYPVVLRRFSLRSGSGGAGMYPGGDGVIRDIELRLPMSVSILSERRSFAPYGMAGGEDGQRGKNTWITKAGRCINVGGKGSIRVQPGDRFVIETPGGGGYGPPGELVRSERDESIVMPTFIPVANGSVAANRALAEQV
ncbi:Hydantoinase B/oxoprolinase-domain-containing protein [Aspergillus minisclerotigenes]|uniref:Hydantoinase B/oxoprolinase-domain-containing protein n=1 Tax=Aspergillus minisclerotigenes TaxID=656917 RepID=A0A5N6IWN4_9EURO|nr:Hydantoinase B/oxoprolinase-domain-containing protein [Aspergillus minisclerotigenes]